MAGANNKALKHAGMTAREVEVFRASGGKSLRATVTAAKHSPTVQGANADFRAKAAAGLKSMAERKAALQAARQQRVGKSLGAAMQIARGMREDAAAKQAADAQAKAIGPAASPRVTRALGDLARTIRKERDWNATNPWREADSVDGKSGDHWSKEVSRLDASKPRPFNKLYRDPSKAPPGAKEKHDAQMRAWNSAYRKAQKNNKKAIELSNAAYRVATDAQRAERLRRNRDQSMSEIRRDMKSGKGIKATFLR